MKTKLITVTAVVALGGAASAQTSLSTAGGTLAGGITYTYSPGVDSAVDNATAGDIGFTGPGTNGGPSDFGSFTFSAPVIFFVEEVSGVDAGGRPFGFTPSDSFFTFAGDAGAWSVTETNPTDVDFIITGSSLEGNANVPLFSSDDWGSATLTGTTVVELSGNDVGLDSYNLSAQAAPIPEPSSAILLGLGAFGFLARRKR